ncbi:MAG: universal stress protein [Alphaproteobacteria bacterium]
MNQTAPHGTAPAMAPLKRILAVCTREETDAKTLEAALVLADRWGAALQILTVVEMPAELDRLARATGTTRAEGEQRLIESHTQRLQALAASVAPGRSLPVDVRVGKCFLEIIRHVLAHRVDLVVKTAEDLGGSLRFLFASTDQHLLRKCPCPVWLRLADRAPTAPSGTRLAKTILAAVDVDAALTDEPDTQQALNRSIVETAAAMAAVDGATIRLLHVWDAPSEGLIRLWSPDTSDHGTAERYVRDVQMAHRRALDHLIAGARTWIGKDLASRITFVPMLRHGVARAVIPEEVAATHADLLVMGTIARIGVPGFIIGNTAEDVLNSVDCPVVTVKPPGYVSPVIAWPDR